MKYFLQRDGRTYGPYSFDDLKRYQAENRIGPNDMVRREDSQNWEPWQQVLNPPAAAPAAPVFTPPAAPVAPVFTPPAQSAPTPQPSFQPPAQQGFGAPPAQQGFGAPPAQPSPFGQPPAQDPWAQPTPSGGGFGSTPPATPPSSGGFGGFGQQAQGFGQQVQQGFGQAGIGGPPAGGFGGGGGGVGPMPPDMQWYIVLLISCVCSLFGLYWIFKQAGFVQQIDPSSTAKKKYTMGLILLIGSYIFVFAMSALGAMMEMYFLSALSMLGMIGVLGGIVYLILAHFEMRKSIHNYYNTVEPMGINLMDTQGAVMTFFFNIYFFQYHFANIAARKKAMGHQ